VVLGGVLMYLAPEVWGGLANKGDGKMAKLALINAKEHSAC
jgi:hypothetical protein